MGRGVCRPRMMGYGLAAFTHPTARCAGVSLKRRLIWAGTTVCPRAVMVLLMVISIELHKLLYGNSFPLQNLTRRQLRSPAKNRHTGRPVVTRVGKAQRAHGIRQSR